MTFTINRPTWLRGKDDNSSMLLNSQGMQCCMGQVASQCGVPNDQLLEVTTIYKLNEKNPVNLLPEDIKKDDMGWVYNAYQINDDPTITDEARESKLITLAKENGHAFIFIN